MTPNAPQHDEQVQQHARRAERAWLPRVAFVFVILALIALAATPAVLLQRIDRVMDDITQTILPTYEAMRAFESAMEQRVSAARSRFAVGDALYAGRLLDARSAEAAALAALDTLAPRLGPEATRHLRLLRAHVAGRDSLEAALQQDVGNLDAYRDVLPAFDRHRDSMVVHLSGLRQELVRAAGDRIEDEGQWARLQRGLSAVLGVVAVVAALIVGWSGITQRRMRHEIQRSLAESQRLRLQAEERRHEIERVTESRARLMRGFTHDVKNPLGAASGYLELLRDGFMGPLNAEQARAVGRAGTSIAAALNLLEDLLDLARAEAGSLDIAPAPLDLARLVLDTAEEYRAQAESRGLDYRISVPAAEPAFTDGRRVRQVLGNLISNAIKYTRSGSVTVTLQPSGAGTPGNGRAAIAVTDTGPGIPADRQELLFQEFVRLDPAGEKGAGVGLTISRRVADLLGGEITLHSEEGRGSTFTLWLPLQTTDTGRPGAA